MEVQHLVDQFRGPLLGLLASWGASPADAHDLAQDTLVEAYLARERLRGDPGDPRVVGPWLRGIARNLHRAQIRRKGREQAEDPSVQQHIPADPRIADPGDADSEGGLSEEVRRALGRLKPEFATVLCMHYLEETSVRTVAAMLELPEKTVEGRLYRARIELRRLLEDSSAESAPSRDRSSQNDPSTTGSER